MINRLSAGNKGGSTFTAPTDSRSRASCIRKTHVFWYVFRHPIQSEGGVGSKSDQARLPLFFYEFSSENSSDSNLYESGLGK